MVQFSKPTCIVKVKQNLGNKFISQLRNLNLLSCDYKIFTKDDYIFIPINQTVDINEIFESNINLSIIESSDVHFDNFLVRRESKTVSGNLKEVLRPFIPEEWHELIPRSFDILGNIAIIEVNRPEQIPLRPFISIMANKMLERFPNLESVYEKGGNVHGDYRTRKMNFLAGKNQPLIKYKENGSLFYVNIEKTFFSQRLNFERLRVANQNNEFCNSGWTWDMFCGVGPFLLQIAKNHPSANYIGTDINPEAIKLAVDNIQLNKITSNIHFYCQDLANIEKFSMRNQLEGQISRIIMNLPERNLEFLHLLPDFMDPKGTLLHIYQFNEKKGDALTNAEILLTQGLMNQGINIHEIVEKKIVKPFSPALDTTVIDAIIKKK